MWSNSECSSLILISPERTLQRKMVIVISWLSSLVKCFVLIGCSGKMLRPVSSYVSRIRPLIGSSPGSSLPPGISQIFALCGSLEERLRIRSLLCSTIKALTEIPGFGVSIVRNMG